MPIWSREAFVSALALSLLHSLWQGALIGLLGLTLSLRLKRATPDVRCGAFSVLLCSFAAICLGTFCCLYQAQTRPASFVSGVSHSVTILLIAPARGVKVDDAFSVLHLIYTALVGAWAVGVGVLCLRHIGGSLFLRRLSETESAPCPPEWEARADRLAKRMGIRRKIRIRCSSRIDVPFAFGLFKSSILLPLSAMTGLAPEQTEALIAHELAHFARHDVLLNLVQICMETVLFYHPVVRWLSTQIRAAREQHCDDLAIQAIGDRAVYARALYALEEARASIPQMALGAKGDTSEMTNTQLTRRIRRVLGVSGAERRDPWAKGAMAFGAAIVGLATLLPIHAYSSNPAVVTAPAQTVKIQAFSTTQIMMDIDGDKIQFSGDDLTPNTPVTVNGVVGRFGDLTPKQQQTLSAAEHPQGRDVSTFTSSETMMDIDGDKIQFSGDLTANTPVTVNGVMKRFGDLTPKQQQTLSAATNPIDIKNIIAAMPAGGIAAMPAGGANAKVHFFSMGQIVLDINGSKIELSTTDLKPDTPVKVNGVTGLFGALTPQQQQEIREQLYKMAIIGGSSPNIPLTPEMVSTIIRSIKASNLPPDVAAKGIADAMAQAAAKP